MSSTTVNYRETLITYLRADSTEEAAKTLGITVPSLKYRLNTMKKHGVNVPIKQPKLFTDLMVAQLNSIINKHKQESK